MTRKITSLILLSFLFSTAIRAQDTTTASLLPYLHGVRAKGALLLNVRGYEIVVDQAAGNVSRPYFAKMFPGFDLHQGYKVIPDSSMGIQAYYIDRGGQPSYNVCYFIQKNANTVAGIAIAGAKPPGKVFEQRLLQLILNNGIPDSLISVLGLAQLQFAGRNITVDGGCRWMGSNVMQCHGFGEMNWSMHPDLEEAQEQSVLQETKNAQNKLLDIEQRSEVPVIFEGAPVQAIKIQYRVKGVTGLLAKQEGSRTLIVYYVTAFVRNCYVSAALSYWTSDYIAEDGLPPLLSTVMQLKK